MFPECSWQELEARLQVEEAGAVEALTPDEQKAHIAKRKRQVAMLPAIELAIRSGTSQQFSEHSVNIQGTFSEHSVNIQ